MRPLTTLLVGLALGAGVGVALRIEAVEAAPTPVTGVWSFVSETNLQTGAVRDGKELSAIWVFTDGHHCVARMQNGRTALSREQLASLSAAEQAAHYEQLLRYVSNAGPYVVSGSTLRRQWQISRDPTMLGQESVGSFSADAERLVVTLPGRAGGSGTRVVYGRLE